MFHLSVAPLIEHYGVFIVAALIMLGEMGLPTGISAEVALLLTGALAIHTLPGLFGGVLLIAVADLIGTTLLFLAMRSQGNSILRRVLRRLHRNETATIDRWRARLEGRQSRVVFAVRLLPLVRMYIAITTGLMRIRVRAFMLGAAPAAAIWVGLPIVAGFALRTNVEEVQARYATLSHFGLLLSPLAGGSLAILFWIRNGTPRAERIRRLRLVAGFSTAFAGAAYIATSTWLINSAQARGEVLVNPSRIWPWYLALGSTVVLLLISGAGDLRFRPATLGTQASARISAIGGWRTVITAAAMVAALVLAIAVERQFGLW